MDLLIKLLSLIIMLVLTVLFVRFGWFPFFRKHLVAKANQKAWENDWHVYFFTMLGEGDTFAYESKFIARLAFTKHILTPDVKYDVHPPDGYYTKEKSVQISKNQKKLITMIHWETHKRLYTYVG